MPSSTSSTATTGLQKALADPYDAIVLDLLLPGLDGLSLCRQLRHAGRTQVPVLMLTAKDLLADKIEGFEAGADDYLVKPFSLAELDARLKALVRRARLPETPRILSVGDLRFDLDTLEAERGGERLKLNPTTRRLLIVLLQNSHRVVTRAGARARAVGRLSRRKATSCAPTCTRCARRSTRTSRSSSCTRSMAPAIDFRQNRFVRRLNDWYSRLSLRARIAGTMIALVASAGLVLSAWAYLADEQLKRNITLDLLSEELTHFEQRMRVDRGAEPLRSARLRIYRSSDLAELPRRIAMLKPGEMHRVRSGGRLLDVLVRDGDFGRLYITYDVTTYATQDAIALARARDRRDRDRHRRGARRRRRFRRRLVEPVTALAERLTQIDPGERHVRIGAQFAGNELEPIARSIDMFMERLDGFVEREQSFTATASHELRTPLAVMRGAVELLETSGGRSAGRGQGARANSARRARDD